MTPAYDRELIAEMLDDYRWMLTETQGKFTRAAVQRQMDALREAANAENARTVNRSAASEDAEPRDDVEKAVVVLKVLHESSAEQCRKDGREELAVVHDEAVSLLDYTVQLHRANMALPEDAASEDGLPRRYRLTIEGRPDGWGAYPEPDENGEWCKFSEVRQIDLGRRLASEQVPEVQP